MKRDYLSLLRKLLSHAPRLEPQDAALRRAVENRELTLTPNDGAVTISFASPSTELLHSVQRYLTNLGLFVDICSEQTPEGRVFTLDVAQDAAFIGRSPSLAGRGLEPNAALLETLAENRSQFTHYYTVLKKLHRLADSRLEGVSQHNAAQLASKPGAKPVITINTMDGLAEVMRAVEGESPHVEWTRAGPEEMAAVQEQCERSGQHVPQGGKFASLTGYTGQNFYAELAGELGKAMRRPLAMQVHPSHRSMGAPPSVLEIPVDAMLQNPHPVQAVLDKFLKIKSTLAFSPQVDVTRN